MRKFEGLVVPSNIDLRELLQDLTVMAHNKAFNGSITEEDLDPNYNRQPYRVNWDLSLQELLKLLNKHKVLLCKSCNDTKDQNCDNVVNKIVLNLMSCMKSNVSEVLLLANFRMFRHFGSY
jgi:hypothetical protein